jgi:hypothetical protein
MTPRRGALAEPAWVTATGGVQMMVLAEGLRLALLDEGSQVQPYRSSEDHPFDALHDLNHPSTCPIAAGHLDLSGKLDGGIFHILCQTIQLVDEIRSHDHSGQCDTASDGLLMRYHASAIGGT